jgi:hypothetical protein
MPGEVFLKAAGLGSDTALFAYSLGVRREDDLPFAELRLPPGPFADGSYDLFVRGKSVEATMTRVQAIAEEVAALPPSALGQAGLRLTLQRSLPAVLLDMLDQAMGAEASVERATPDTITLWFDGGGRLDAIELARRDEAFHIEVSLAYEEMDRPLPELAGPLFRPEPLRPQGPVEGVTAAAAQLPMAEQLAEPVLNSWILAALSLVLVGACTAIVVRLVRTPGE